MKTCEFKESNLEHKNYLGGPNQPKTGRDILTQMRKEDRSHTLYGNVWF